MKKVATILTLIILAASQSPSVFAQAKIKLTGSVVDSQQGLPVPYATVAVLNYNGKFITGATTDENGNFNIVTDSSKIHVEVSFIGFKKKTIDKLQITNGKVNLGTIKLTSNVEEVDEVVVVGEKSKLEFKLDKRVFNVGKDISSTGVGALEVLNNVPSVNVDLEGQITLRGNSGVQILVNGKPTVAGDDGNKTLSTITADMIDRIEVITNPSAKYEAEGTSGIINIVLKKEGEKDLNGSISINTGWPANHSVGVSLNKRTNKFNLFTQMGGGYRSLPRYREDINRDLTTNTILESDGIEYRNEGFVNLTLGTDYYINKNNVITLSGNYAYEFEDQPSKTEFNFYDESNTLASSWERSEITTAGNPKWRYDLQYKKQFKGHEDHQLLFSTLGHFFGKEQNSVFNNQTSLGATSYNDQKTETSFYEADYTFKLDYTNPYSEHLTFETGGIYDLKDVGNKFAVFDKVNNVWVTDSGLTNDFNYDQKVLGIYGTGAYEKEKWGVKLGVRVENTDLKTLLVNTNEENKQNYTNLFPSIHTQYKISKFASLQAGYSRRISRPRLWDLNPFFNIRNNFNVRKGNPNLQPEFSDSYEITSVFIFKKASLNMSMYHLYTTNKIERVAEFKDNVNITLPMNVGISNKTGLEINGKYTPTKWLSMNGDVNYGYFDRKGNFNGQEFNFNGSQWSSKLTTKFRLHASTDLEVSTDYQSGYKTVQGRTSGFAFVNAGLRNKIWKGKVILSIGIRDVFVSRIRETIVSQPDYYLYSYSTRGRFLTFGISYGIGKGEAMTYSGRRHH